MSTTTPASAPAAPPPNGVAYPGPPTGDRRAPAGGRHLPALLVLGGWTVLGLAQGAELYLRSAMDGSPIGFGRALGLTMVAWYTWAALAPAIVRVAARIDDGRRGRRAVVGLHAIAAVAAVAAQIAIYVVVVQWVIWRDPRIEALPHAFAKYLTIKSATGLLTYAMIVGVHYALVFHRRFRDRDAAAARLAAQAAELRSSLAQAKLDALHGQLQPHFLFNALHAVSSLVVAGESRAAERMLARLGRLLRATLEIDPGALHPLAAEIGLLEGYLEVERTRFPDRLGVEYRIQPDCDDALVPPLLLQPLVENAVHHAVAVDPRAGRISIEARRDGDRLCLAVRDDGPGAEAAAADAAAPGASPPDDGDRRAVGLANVAARLAVAYGEDAALTLRRLRPRGTAAVVTLPFRAAGEPSGEGEAG